MFKKERIIVKDKTGKIDGLMTIVELKDKVMIELELESFYINKKLDIFINDNKIISGKTNQKGVYNSRTKIENLSIKDIKEIEINLDNEKIYEIQRGIDNKKEHKNKKETAIINNLNNKKEVEIKEDRKVIDEDIKLKNNSINNKDDDIKNDEKYLIEVNNVDKLLERVKKYKV